MKGQSVPAPELSKRVRDLIRRIFPPEEQPIIQEMIQEFHWAPAPAVDERIHLDILEICEGKRERVRELVELAKADWRDLIVTAEYDGTIVQNERGRRRLTELSEAQEHHEGNQ